MSNKVIIKCSSFELREWNESDVKSLVEHANNYNVWINLKDLFPHPYTEDDAREWIRVCNSFDVNTNFAIVINSKAAGGIGVHFFEDVYKYSAEIGYWLGEKYWGKGIATEAVGRMISFVFENFDINRIFARVFDWNLASMKVLENNGFQSEARLRKQVFKDGVFADEIIYGLLKNK
jgi:[ribosomal protein S5]-alanine N-acetyltransferase